MDILKGMDTLVNLLPFSGTPLLQFIALFCLFSAAHMSLHFGFGFLLNLYCQKTQKAKKIQEKETRIAAWTEIKQSWSGFVGTPLCLAVGLWSQYKGWALLPVETTFWTVLFFFVVATLIHDVWFYFVHRLLHTKALIKWHRIHHMSPVPTVWTNDRFTLPDVLMTQSFLAIIPFILPIPARWP